MDRNLLIIGGGHAHVAVLASWIARGGEARATLLTPHPTLLYSGMVPGWIAGEYARDDGVVDIAGLARQAGFELVLDRCTGLDPERRIAFTQSGREIAFDIASIDTGGVGRARAVLGEDERMLDVRPIDAFVEQLDARPLAQRIAVIGGGAGGVELAFALRNRANSGSFPDVTQIAGKAGLLPSMAPAVSNRVRAELRRQNIRLIEADAELAETGLGVGGERLEPVDLIVAALGSAAPQWPKASGLACDEQGFIAVDQYQRSISHPHIYAAGDVAARTDREVAHSGVHAVHTGPVLAANLRAAIVGQIPSQSYTPRPASLYLLSTGNGGAIASYGSVALQGRWVGGLKRWIDKRWIDKYARLAKSA